MATIQESEIEYVMTHLRSTLMQTTDKAKRERIRNAIISLEIFIAQKKKSNESIYGIKH